MKPGQKEKPLKELYLGGESLKKEEVMPDDFKNFFVNFVYYLLGKGEGGKR